MLSAHLEGDVLACLGEGMSQEKHVIHPNAEGQEGQDLPQSSWCQQRDWPPLERGLSHP